MNSKVMQIALEAKEVECDIRFEVQTVSYHKPYKLKNSLGRNPAYTYTVENLQLTNVISTPSTPFSLNTHDQ